MAIDRELIEKRMNETTPMMRQYLETKLRCGDSLLFFRLGDFYEMFFEDAQIVSRELELMLTGKDCGMEERAPMCGIPYHAATTYISRLISKGYKVAICEQLEDPATAKGLVKRDIIKVYTPGTVTDERMLDQKTNNYIACVFGLGKIYGLAVADITTGELNFTSVSIGSTLTHLKDELARVSPREIIINKDCTEIKEITAAVETYSGAFVNIFENKNFDRDLCAERLEALGTPLKGVDDWAIRAAGCLVDYLTETQKTGLKGVVSPKLYKVNEFLVIDAQSRRNLEITETMRDRKKHGSLLWVLDRTETAMGGRLLKRWVEQPLIDKPEIDKRLDAVAELYDKFMLRSELAEHLKGVYDVDRLASKLSLGGGNARELLSVKASLQKIPAIKLLLRNASSKILKEVDEELKELPELADLLERAIAEDPPVTITDGGIIRTGYDEAVDRYRQANSEGKDWLAELETREREATGIKKLKVGFNSVFGYYIEVTNSFRELVPANYVRKQTLANAERYITEELKKLEEDILGAEKNLKTREEQLFKQVRETACGYCDVLKKNAEALSIIDALCSLASVAERENYVRPEITEENVIELKGSRHPIIEKMPGCDSFVPNDALLDGGENELLVITGPNMAGKSTYMRQVALITLMAQTGSFVPADSAKIGLTDRIFTRVGASDDLAQGRSTFMVEMCEVANIVENATDRSLLILDEIGRGTSTFDGLSIAWAVLEYIVKNLKSRTLFATHYHELTELEGRLDNVKNYCVAVHKKGDEITFLRKIKRGGADGSYGIAVAKLAGLPDAITLRANEILALLEKQDVGKNQIKKAARRKQGEDNEPDLFAFAAASVMQDDIIEELKGLDVTKLTPMECMNILYGLQQRAKERK